jgi:hypothetical protein
MTVYLITAHETENSMGFAITFPPEIFATEEKAVNRLAHVQACRQKYSGMFYALTPVVVDVENEDF